MSDQQAAEQANARDEVFNKALRAVKKPLGNRMVIENKKDGTIDFDYGSVVVTCAHVLEAEKGRTLAINFNTYGDGAAVFGPNLTNYEVEAIKRDFKVTTVVRSGAELSSWARSLDKSGMRKVAESIEQVNDALKPAKDAVETIKAVKECLATALVVGAAGQQFFAKFVMLDLALQSAQGALTNAVAIGGTGMLNPVTDMIQDPHRRSWFVGTIKKTLNDAQAAFSKENMQKRFVVPLRRRRKTREQESSRRESSRFARR